MTKRLSKPFRILLLLTALSLLGYAAFRVVVSSLIGQEVTRWRQAGMPVVIEDFSPTDGSSIENVAGNGAPLFREAIATMKLGDFTGADIDFMKQLYDDPVAGPASPTAITKAKTYLADRESGLDYVLQAMSQPELRFDVNWRAALSGMSDRNHLLGLIHWNRVLRCRLYVALAEGRSGDAVADLERTLHMTDSLAGEPRLDAYFVRIAILRSVAAAAARVANRTTLSPATSRRLAATFAESLRVTDLPLAINGERCLNSARYLVPIGRSDALCRSPDDLNPLFTLPVFGDLMDVQLLRFYSVMREYEQASQHFGINRLVDNEAHHPHQYQLPSLVLLHREQAEFTAAMDLARYGLLLDAALSRGENPQSLADLFPQEPRPNFLDPCASGDETYAFLKNDHEYRIYSVGRNGIDESGTEQYFVDGLREFRGGDIAFIRRLK